MKKNIIIVAAVLAVILMTVIGINSVTASAIAHEEKVTEAYSDIKVQEKRRAELVIFWIFWIVLTIGLVIGFYYLEKRWLE